MPSRVSFAFQEARSRHKNGLQQLSQITPFRNAIFQHRIEAVPFENPSILSRETITLDLEQVYNKIVKKRHGEQPTFILCAERLGYNPMNFSNSDLLEKRIQEYPSIEPQTIEEFQFQSICNHQSTDGFYMEFKTQDDNDWEKILREKFSIILEGNLVPISVKGLYTIWPSNEFKTFNRINS
ncbi:arylamine N-acetyltransferase, pineal gland isozyme NAT-10-like [Python bivittatus]|uniref:arylamine N-acetyltransferase n=1 Tax=Python bivittatus TaxID=176946 RepID=A0A9F5MV47_PYTBI|nr:arylamine N-acetyltransferase, pineal gland isozyme NAT-10-like [Python bivittatus]